MTQELLADRRFGSRLQFSFVDCTETVSALERGWLAFAAACREVDDVDNDGTRAAAELILWKQGGVR